jgi:cytoskeletal protein RodZ
MRIIWLQGSKRCGSVAPFVGVVLCAMVLATGCADRTGGQAAVGGATSIAVTTTTQPSATTATDKGSQTTADPVSTTGSSSATEASPTTRRRPSTNPTGSPTTKPKPKTTKSSATSKPDENPKLTVSIDDRVNAGGAVQVDPGGNCTSSCGYTFPKGTSITLTVTNGLEVLSDWEVSGGQSACDGLVGSCSLTLNDDTTVTLLFNGG